MNKRLLVIVAIVLAGIAIAITIVKTAPKPIKKPSVVLEPLVEVSALEMANVRPSWQGGAAVNANKSVLLVAQVTGQVVSMSSLAVPGSYVNKGTELAVIDDANYQFSYEQKKAKVVQAQASLDMELAQVENAKKDYQRSGMKLNPSGKALALREPQLASAKAAFAIANSELKKAKLDLTNTRLSMPFNGHVLAQNVSEGAFVSNANPVFEILDTQQYWLEVKVPQSFIAILDKDHPAEISLLTGKEKRKGTILNILPQVNATDRQARILISIEDPLLINATESKDESQAADTLPIRYNDYVQVTLFGKNFENSQIVDTDSLDASGTLWVVDKFNKLQSRTVTVLYSGRERSWVNIQSESGDQLLMSSLDAPKSGELVRLVSGPIVSDSIVNAIEAAE